MSDQDAVALTRSLLRYDTVNPPGRERDCARHLGALLETWGYRVAYHEFAEERTSVIARTRDHAGALLGEFVVGDAIAPRLEQRAEMPGAVALPARRIHRVVSQQRPGQGDGVLVAHDSLPEEIA